MHSRIEHNTVTKLKTSDFLAWCIVDTSYWNKLFSEIILHYSHSKAKLQKVRWKLLKEKCIAIFELQNNFRTIVLLWWQNIAKLWLKCKTWLIYFSQTNCKQYRCTKLKLNNKSSQVIIFPNKKNGVYLFQLWDKIKSMHNANRKVTLIKRLCLM